jgi:hypothetical protein
VVAQIKNAERDRHENAVISTEGWGQSRPLPTVPTSPDQPSYDQRDWRCAEVAEGRQDRESLAAAFAHATGWSLQRDPFAIYRM